jgi:hypothetical protein
LIQGYSYSYFLILLPPSPSGRFLGVIAEAAVASKGVAAEVGVATEAVTAEVAIASKASPLRLSPPRSPSLPRPSPHFRGHPHRFLGRRRL